jgi:hypothetical protein
MDRENKEDTRTKKKKEKEEGVGGGIMSIIMPRHMLRHVTSMDSNMCGWVLGVTYETRFIRRERDCGEGVNGDQIE